MPTTLPDWLKTLLGRLPNWPATLNTPLRRVRASLVVGIIVAAGTLGWAIAAATGTWLDNLVAGLPVPPPLPPKVVDTSAKRVQPLTTFDAIYSTNIFHARRSGAGPASAAAGPIKLTLTGTFHIGSTAFAIVVGPDGRTEDVYRNGQCMPRTDPETPPPCPAGQGRLERVDYDRITVNFNGQRSVIVMEAQPLPSNGPNPPARSPVATAPAQEQGPNVPFAQTRTGNTIEVHLPAAEVEKSFENFSELVRQALVVPFAKDGQTVGFQIQRIQPGSVFQRIGLQNQDVIRGVNGQPITTADQALRLFSLFRNERHVTLDLDRGGDSIQMSYIIE